MRQGGMRVRGSDELCLRGPPANQDNSQTVITGTCNRSEMRFFFHFDVKTNQTKFCHPNPNKNNECRWDLCLEATHKQADSLVKRKNCTSANGAGMDRQQWVMPKVTGDPNHRYIKLASASDLCLKQELSG